jgi:hypothetical protein
VGRRLPLGDRGAQSPFDDGALDSVMVSRGLGERPPAVGVGLRSVVHQASPLRLSDERKPFVQNVGRRILVWICGRCTFGEGVDLRSLETDRGEEHRHRLRLAHRLLAGELVPRVAVAARERQSRATLARLHRRRMHDNDR